MMVLPTQPGTSGCQWLAGEWLPTIAKPGGQLGMDRSQSYWMNARLRSGRPDVFRVLPSDKLRQSEERQAERAASRLADAVAEDVERNLEQLDLILLAVMGGDQSAASRDLTQQQHNALAFERTPRDR
jgi:hypothetical protein